MGGNLSEYKKIPVSTKNGNTHTKIIFTSPHSQAQNKSGYQSSQASKKLSPDSSSNTYMKTGVEAQSEQQQNIMNFLKRRASEEKQQTKMNTSSQSKEGSQNRQQANLMYQDYIYQKSRSPQNQQKKDYYMMMNTQGSNFGMKPTNSSQQLTNQSSNSGHGSSQ